MFLANDNLYAGSHSRQQTLVIVPGTDNNHVSHHTRYLYRLLSHLHDFSPKHPIGISIYRKAGLLALGNSPDISLVDADLQMNITKVLSQSKQHRCLQTRSDGLSNICCTVDHDTVNRRPDQRMTQFEFGLEQLALTGRHLRECSLYLGFLFFQAGSGSINAGIRLIVQCHGTVDGALGHDLSRKQCPLTLEILGKLS